MTADRRSFSSNTYYVPFDVAMPHVNEARHMISYYQWVPLILVSQALLYFLPCLFWRFLNRRIGLNLPSIIEASRATQKAVFPETREKSIRYVVMQVGGVEFFNFVIFFF